MERVREDDIGEPEPPVLREGLCVEDEPDFEALRGILGRPHESVRAPVHIQAPLENVRRGEPDVSHLDSRARLELLLKDVGVVVRLDRLEDPVVQQSDSLVPGPGVAEPLRDPRILVEQTQYLRPERPGLLARQRPRDVAPAAEPAKADELEVRSD